MKIRTLVVDDEPLARDRITGMLGDEPEFEVLGTCGDGVQAVEAILQQEPDLVLLDIQMPGVDGFGVIERVGADRMPATVFVTAHDEFAFQAFEAQAIDYLLKPVDRVRFSQMLARAKQQVQPSRNKELERKLSLLLRTLRTDYPKEYLDRFIIRNGARITFVNAAEVEWMGSDGNYVTLYVNGRGHLVRDTLSALEARLDPEHFVRIHRSTIINLRYVRVLESVFQGEYLVLMQDGAKLNSSRTYRERLESAVGIA